METHQRDSNRRSAKKCKTSSAKKSVKSNGDITDSTRLVRQDRSLMSRAIEEKGFPRDSLDHRFALSELIKFLSSQDVWRDNAYVFNLARTFASYMKRRDRLLALQNLLDVDRQELFDDYGLNLPNFFSTLDQMRRQHMDDDDARLGDQEAWNQEEFERRRRLQRLDPTDDNFAEMMRL